MNCTTMESALNLSAFAQPFVLGDAIKSWFTIFLEANQIVIAENLHALAFSDIATTRELRQLQLQLISSSRLTILAPGREVNNLPLAAGLAGTRRGNLLTVIPSQTSVKKQECRRTYRRKRSSCFKSPPFKSGPRCGRTTIYQFTILCFR